MSDPLADRLDILGDALADVLETAGHTGWSHSQTDHALTLIGALFDSMAQQSGGAADVLADARSLAIAARWAVSDEPLPPEPRPGSNAARAEAATGAAQYRDWAHRRWLGAINAAGT